MRREKLYSLLVNEIHDELVIDTHPDEFDTVTTILREEMLSVRKRLKEIFDYDFLALSFCHVTDG